jgi:hypothetical protein
MAREIPTMHRNNDAVVMAKYLQNPVATLTAAIPKKLISKSVWNKTIMRIARPRTTSISGNRDDASMVKDERWVQICVMFRSPEVFPDTNA